MTLSSLRLLSLERSDALAGYVLGLDEWDQEPERVMCLLPHSLLERGLCILLAEPKLKE